MTINEHRLWQSIMEMAKLGETAKGGSRRLALTDIDKAGRDLFVAWCEDLDCTITVDPIGNLFAHRGGLDNKLPTLLVGSHLDTQPHGGRFDGVYGVLAGLEVFRSLEDEGRVTPTPLTLVVWTNEEGARFPRPLTGSSVFSKLLSLQDAYALCDRAGITIKDELDRLGYTKVSSAFSVPVGAYFETHIEQGPVLEQSGKIIGLVSGIQGARLYRTTVLGEEAHAGTTPLASRRDALLLAAELIVAANRAARSRGADIRLTVGSLHAFPNSPNTVPGCVEFTIDLRAPSEEDLDALERALYQLAAAGSEESGLAIDLTKTLNAPPMQFDHWCMESVRRSIEFFGYAYMEIPSGAGHDAYAVAHVAPAAMIFVPCEKGVSHNERENAAPEHLAAGCNVLKQTLITHSAWIAKNSGKARVASLSEPSRATDES